MKIVIFAGGTGSVALQTGLYEVFRKDVLDYTLITNLADNGLSTGTCRKVMDGKIMGPSDLRKNQMLRAKLIGKVDQGLYAFLDERFTAKACDAKKYLTDGISNLSICDSHKTTLNLAVDEFFSASKALDVDYDDFSVANIIYSGLARAHSYSLSAAGKQMAPLLGIPVDGVLASDDTPMYLYADTESGHRIYDEGDLVCWANANDKVVGCGYLDANGKEVTPTLSDESVKAINDAEVIIFSSGTQWSSLIPTYISNGFKEAIANSKAKKYLVLNNSIDKDIYGVSGDELLHTLNKYLPMKDITTLVASDGDYHLIPTGTDYPVIVEPMSVNKNGKILHDPEALVRVMFTNYYGKALCNNAFVFDYDDTLVARGHTMPEVSESNIRYFNALPDDVWICTGNSAKALSNKILYANVAADGGVNHYRKVLYNTDFIEHLDASLAISKEDHKRIHEILLNVGINAAHIEDRGNVMVSIKPVDPEYRRALSLLLQNLLPSFIVKPTGRTTIDIFKAGASKDVLLNTKLKSKRVTFLGDEYQEGGNDFCLVNHPRVDFIKVNSPKDTNMFLSILEGVIKWTSS